MSEFLANLARRAAGLAPSVDARPGAVALVADSAPFEGDGVHAEPTSGGEATSSRLVSDGSAPPALPVARVSTDVTAPGTGSPPIAAVAVPMVQRIVLPATAAPVTTAAAALPAPAFSPVTPVARDAGPNIVRNPQPIWGVSALPAVAADGSRAGIDATSLPPAAPQDVTEVSSAPVPATPELPIVERFITNTNLVEPARDTARAHDTENSPSPLPAVVQAATPAPGTDTLPERVVHVRIGAIEIHGAVPVAAPAPPAPHTLASVPSSDGGFDRFARMRTYAPSEW